MKDYRLSEIKEICKTTIGGCNNCGVQNECHLLSAQQPHGWDIEPRNMLDLPCKQQLDIENRIYQWEVIYRGKDGLVYFNMFGREAQADAFLAELKGDKK